jgi:hypothetical protein
MSETIDVASWLVLLSKVMSDDAKREEIIARISAVSGVKPQDVTEILYAALEVLSEYLPVQ